MTGTFNGANNLWLARSLNLEESLLLLPHPHTNGTSNCIFTHSVALTSYQGSFFLQQHTLPQKTTSSQDVRDHRRCSAPTETATTQSLHLRLRENSGRGGRETVKTQRARTSTLRLFKIFMKGNIATDSQLYGCLNKTRIMTTPVDIPMWMGES